MSFILLLLAPCITQPTVSCRSSNNRVWREREAALERIHLLREREPQRSIAAQRCSALRERHLGTGSRLTWFPQGSDRGGKVVSWSWNRARYSSHRNSGALEIFLNQDNNTTWRLCPPRRRHFVSSLCRCPEELKKMSSKSEDAGRWKQRRQILIYLTSNGDWSQRLTWQFTALIVLFADVKLGFYWSSCHTCWRPSAAC